MAKYDEKEILRHMEIVSKWQPTSEAADQAIERVRKTLTEAQVSKKKGRQTVKQLLEFAAAAVIILAVCWFAVSEKGQVQQQRIDRPAVTIKSKKDSIFPNGALRS